MMVGSFVNKEFWLFDWLEAVFPSACNGLFQGVSLGGDGGMSAGLQLKFPVFFCA